MDAFEGQVALVTGAGGGIGLATASAFAAAGASVIIADRDVALIETAADELRSTGHQALDARRLELHTDSRRRRNCNLFTSPVVLSVDRRTVLPAAR